MGPTGPGGAAVTYAANALLISDAAGAPTGSAAPASIIPFISGITEAVQPILDDAVLWADDEPLEPYGVIALYNGFARTTNVTEEDLDFLYNIHNEELDRARMV